MPAARNLEKISFYSSLLSVTGLVAMLLLSQIPLNVRIGGCFLIALWVIKNYPAIGATLSALGCGQQAAISGLNIAACLVIARAAAPTVVVSIWYDSLTILADPCIRRHYILFDLIRARALPIQQARAILTREPISRRSNCER